MHKLRLRQVGVSQQNVSRQYVTWNQIVKAMAVNWQGQAFDTIGIELCSNLTRKCQYIGFKRI